MQSQDSHWREDSTDQSVDIDEKMSHSVQSSGSLKKCKHQAADIDISAMTEQTKPNAIGSLIPLLTDFSKK